MVEYKQFLEEIKRFEREWGMAPEWAYKRLKKLEKGAKELAKDEEYWFVRNAEDVDVDNTKGE